MCGICGAVSFDSSNVILDENVLYQMCNALIHRGPDDEGFYSDSKSMLGVRRLSIIDLETGHQPITNEDKSLWLVFNGEIYNFKELRAALVKKGHLFTTKSDSEVIVHAYEEYGEKCVEYFNGMFAIAIWDIPKQRLFLARDHLGIKPLYYWIDQNALIFGSELKTILMHPMVSREIDLIALDQFLSLEYIPGPRTILKVVKKLLPGHRLILQDGQCRVNKYWDVPVQEMKLDEGSAVERLRELIYDSVRMQLVSDVPVGAFLSGGIDSSTIVAMMRKVNSGNINTFSIGFDDSSYNELPFARTVAGQFNTIHYEEILRPNILQSLNQVLERLDEPIADFSIIPTYLVSCLAREHVKVVLSGDGGDELFGGYDTYLAQQLDRVYNRLPGVFRLKTLPELLQKVPPRPEKKGWINKSQRFVEGARHSPRLQHVRWMMFMNEVEKNQLYRPELRAALDGDSASAPIEEYFERDGFRDPLAKQQYVDVKTYLVDDILVKVDRMSMAASLETRVPLLDHRLVEFAINLPASWKVRNGQTKLLLRKAMKGILPEAILRKPKQGFSIPLKNWLRGPLLPLLKDTLSENIIRSQGYFDSHTVEQWVKEHLEGRVNHSHRLWALMVFILWVQKITE